MDDQPMMIMTILNYLLGSCGGFHRKLRTHLSTADEWRKRTWVESLSGDEAPKSYLSPMLIYWQTLRLYWETQRVAPKSSNYLNGVMGTAPKIYLSLSRSGLLHVRLEQIVLRFSGTWTGSPPYLKLESNGLGLQWLGCTDSPLGLISFLC